MGLWSEYLAILPFKKPEQFTHTYPVWVITCFPTTMGEGQAGKKLKNRVMYVSINFGLCWGNWAIGATCSHQSTFPWLWEHRNHRMVPAFYVHIDRRVLSSKRRISEFWVGKLNVRNAHKVHTTLLLTVALETHEMLIRADSALTSMWGTTQLFYKCCLLPKSEKNRGKKEQTVSHLHAGYKSWCCDGARLHVTAPPHKYWR